MAASPSYGQPGYSFAGRKPMQPPGGYSSISFGNDVTPGTSYNYKSSYNVHAPMSASHQGFSSSTYQSPYSLSPQQQYNSSYVSDLSSQLNIPRASPAPASAGRRAISQPTYGPGPNSPTGSSYGQNSGMYAAHGSSGYGGQEHTSSYGGSYNAGSSTYQYGSSREPSGVPLAAYGASSSSAHGAASSACNGLHVNNYGSSSQNRYNSTAASNPYAGPGVSGYSGQVSAGYGTGVPSYSYNGDYSNAYGSAAVGGSYAATGAYGASVPSYGIASGGNAYSPKAYGTIGLYGPSTPAEFIPNQKGQFGGKVITQPPGGRSNINLFG
jgi:hypothetical protein